VSALTNNHSEGNRSKVRIHSFYSSQGSLCKYLDIVRDFKKFTSVHICRAIENNMGESRKHWMLGLFKSAALDSKKHIHYKFW